MKIAIGSDHAGYGLKEKLRSELEEGGHQVTNFGTDSAESVDYPDHVHPLAGSIERGEHELGILLCGSANGVCMTANKHQGVRAAIGWNEEVARLARQHNNANVLCLPARFIGEDEAILFVNAFLSSEFEGGRHQRRVDKIVSKEE